MEQFRNNARKSGKDKSGKSNERRDEVIIETMANFAYALDTIINENGVTQNKIAQLSNLSPSCISDYRRAEQKPTLGNIYKIIKALNVSADYMLGLSEVQSLDMNTKMINSATGLSESAIEYLCTLTENCKKAKKEMDVAEKERMFAEREANSVIEPPNNPKQKNTLTFSSEAELQEFLNNMSENEAKDQLKNILSILIDDDKSTKCDNKKISESKNHESTESDNKTKPESDDEDFKDKINRLKDEEAEAKNAYLIEATKLRALNFILANDKKIDFLYIIGMYLFGIPVFKNDIAEVAELKVATEDVKEGETKISLTQKMPINYFYRFDKNTVLPIMDFMTNEEVYDSLLVRLNNNLSRIGKSLRKQYDSEYNRVLEQYLQNNYTDEEIAYAQEILDENSVS